TSLTPIWGIASTMFWPCETRTSTCRNFATISSGLYRFLAITVLLDVKDIPQVGPLQWGWINGIVQTQDAQRPARNAQKFLQQAQQAPEIQRLQQAPAEADRCVVHMVRDLSAQPTSTTAENLEGIKAS